MNITLLRKIVTDIEADDSEFQNKALEKMLVAGTIIIVNKIQALVLKKSHSAKFFHVTPSEGSFRRAIA